MTAPDGWEIFQDELDEEAVRKAWKNNREALMSEWIAENPCTRPWAWWNFDAPRWSRPFPGCFWDQKLPDPRRRLGGTGTPAHECLAIVPSFAFGIPKSWVSSFQEEYYNGRARDIHGKLIPTSYEDGHFPGRAIDPEDPPVFESEAAYLQRHGLLTPAEVKYLTKHPEALEPETVTK